MEDLHANGKPRQVPEVNHSLLALRERLIQSHISYLHSLLDTEGEFHFDHIRHPLEALTEHESGLLRAEAFGTLIQIARKEMVAGRDGSSALWAAKLFLFPDCWVDKPSPEAMGHLDPQKILQELDTVICLAKQLSFDPMLRAPQRKLHFDSGQAGLEFRSFFQPTP